MFAVAPAHYVPVCCSNGHVVLRVPEHGTVEFERPDRVCRTCGEHVIVAQYREWSDLTDAQRRSNTVAMVFDAILRGGGIGIVFGAIAAIGAMLANLPEALSFAGFGAGIVIGIALIVALNLSKVRRSLARTSAVRQVSDTI